MPIVPTPLLTKATLFFTDGRYGWSEYYHLIGPALAPPAASKVDMVATLKLMKPLIAARVAMLGGPAACNITQAVGSKIATSGPQCAGPSLQLIRLSQVGQVRNTFVFNPYSGQVIIGGAASGLWGNQNLTGTVGQDAADNPYSAVEMILSLANGLTTKRSLSGVPDATICDQSLQSGTGWIQAWSVFAKLLTGGASSGAPGIPYGTASSSLVGAGQTIASSGGIAIESIHLDENCRPVLTLAGPITLGVDVEGCPATTVQIACFKADRGFVNLNGVWRILPPTLVTTSTTTVTQVTLERRTLCLGEPLAFGYVMPYPGPYFSAFIGASLGGPMKKNRGRPFDLHRGKRVQTR